MNCQWHSFRGEEEEKGKFEAEDDAARRAVGVGGVGWMEERDLTDLDWQRWLTSRRTTVEKNRGLAVLGLHRREKKGEGKRTREGEDEGEEGGTSANANTLNSSRTGQAREARKVTESSCRGEALGHGGELQGGVRPGDTAGQVPMAYAEHKAYDYEYSASTRPALSWWGELQRAPGGEQFCKGGPLHPTLNHCSTLSASRPLVNSPSIHFRGAAEKKTLGLRNCRTHEIRGSSIGDGAHVPVHGDSC